MLRERLTDPRKLVDRHYIAEPKLDGQRAQLHIEHRETVACFSRKGLDLRRHPGMAWLRRQTGVLGCDAEWDAAAYIVFELDVRTGVLAN
jgi:ATP-dependent DNA ligase